MLSQLRIQIPKFGGGRGACCAKRHYSMVLYLARQLEYAKCVRPNVKSKIKRAHLQYTRTLLATLAIPLHYALRRFCNRLVQRPPLSSGPTLTESISLSHLFIMSYRSCRGWEIHFLLSTNNTCSNSQAHNTLRQFGPSSDRLRLRTISGHQRFD